MPEFDPVRLHRWRSKVFKKYPPRCMACGSIVGLEGDHIKPKADYPHLAYKVSNGQILCGPKGNNCNQKKGRLIIDYRPIGSRLYFFLIRILKLALSVMFTAFLADQLGYLSLSELFYLTNRILLSLNVLIKLVDRPFDFLDLDLISGSP